MRRRTNTAGASRLLWLAAMLYVIYLYALAHYFPVTLP